MFNASGPFSHVLAVVSVLHSVSILYHAWPILHIHKNIISMQKVFPRASYFSYLVMKPYFATRNIICAGLKVWFPYRYSPRPWKEETLKLCCKYMPWQKYNFLGFLVANRPDSENSEKSIQELVKYVLTSVLISFNMFYFSVFSCKTWWF